jgi:hypothetical protein
MIQTLQKFEDAFPDVDNTREGQIFKTELRNMFNDVIRAQRDELNDYEIEYRPLRMTDSGTLAMTQSFMQTVQKVEFGSRGSIPFMKIFSSQDHARVLDAIRIEFGAGVLYMSTENEMVLEIVGAEQCVNSVLSYMDKCRLHEKTRLAYKVWRSEVVRFYQEQG